MKLPAYPKYKSSGVEWLGDVPAHWEVKRLKYCASINDEALPETTSPDYEFEYVDISSVNAVEGITATQQLIFENAPSRARRQVRPGDTIVSTVRTYLRAIAPIKVPPDNLIVSTGFAVVRPRKVDSAYLAYALRESAFVESVVSRSTGVSYPAVNASEVGVISIPLPSLSEQTAIAGFLDRETGRMDRLVAKKRELIERLQEKRTALIARTVTRGLNPNAKLTPSGLEWLGDVPADWDVKRLKTSATCWVSNVDKVPAEDELPVRLCNYTDVYYHDHITPDLDLMETTATAEEIRRFGLREGDVLITKDSEEWNDIAVPALVKKSAPDLVCGYHLAIIRPHPKVLSGDYLLRAFQACAINQQFQVAASGVTRYGLPKSSIGEAWIPLPPPPEQRLIADFLDRETGRMDRLVAKVEAAIERLQEYRTALITAAVTGKVDVRQRKG